MLACLIGACCLACNVKTEPQQKESKKLGLVLPGFEPGTDRVLGGNHNQLDHKTDFFQSATFCGLYQLQTATK